MSKKTKKIALLGLMTAVALIFSYIESMIPAFTSIPGIKLGLPNIAIVLTLYLYSWKEASAVSLIRIVISSLLFANMYALIYSLSGAVLSLLVMAILKKLNLFDSVGVSIAGGLMHNAGQIICAVLILENTAIAYYFIPLIISGVVAGLVIGVVSGLLVKRLKNVAPDLFS